MKNLSTPLFLALTLVVLFTASGTALAQEHARIHCSECRDPNVHPSDFGNAAFNTLREPNNGYTFDELDVVEVINPDGQWAWINMDFEMMTIDIGFEIPTFVIPTGNIVIETTDASARLTSYVIDLDIPNPLSVGTGVGPGYHPQGGSEAQHYDGSADYRDAWEYESPGQQLSCAGDFSDPNNTAIVCQRH